MMSNIAGLMILAFGVAGWLLWGVVAGLVIAEALLRPWRRRRMRRPPRIRILVPDGEAVLTRIWLDGREVRWVRAVRFQAGSIPENVATVTLELVASVELAGDPRVIAE